MDDESDDRISLQIPVPVYKDLPRPCSQRELDECTLVKAALRDMQIKRIDLIVPTMSGSPIIRVLYVNADPPQAYWAKYLDARIFPSLGYDWNMRLSAIFQNTCELFFAPRSETDDAAFAQRTIKCAGARFNLIRISVPYPEKDERYFSLFH